MMALSTYFNWDTTQSHNSETSTFYEAMPEEVAAPNLHHFFPCSDESLFLSNPIFENYIDPTGGFLYPSEIYPPYDPFIPFTCHETHGIFPTHEDSTLPCPKRQKCFYDNDSSLQDLTTTTVPSSFLEEFSAPYDNPFPLQREEVQPELFYEIPRYETCVDLGCEKKVNERIISPHSIAARERRRKITEKTQELGKLVPGGPKLNTAEMLHATAKYVKYLQAQVGMLELVKSLEEDEAAAPPFEILHDLVVSSIVQEKLYTEEMCFVPKEIVTTLTNHKDVQSRPTIVENLKQLIGTDIQKKAYQE